jgi:hypothetical protein
MSASDNNEVRSGFITAVTAALLSPSRSERAFGIPLA